MGGGADPEMPALAPRDAVARRQDRREPMEGRRRRMISKIAGNRLERPGSCPHGSSWSGPGNARASLALASCAWAGGDVDASDFLSVISARGTGTAS